MIRGYSGFTFIELMIALVIISILTLLAYPSYQQYQRTVNREQAIQLLQVCTAELSLLYKTARSYENIAHSPFPSELQGACNTLHAQSLTHRSYQLKVLAANQDTYQLVVQRQGSQLQDICGDLTLDQNGRKNLLNARNTTIEECW